MTEDEGRLFLELTDRLLTLQNQLTAHTALLSALVTELGVAFVDRAIANAEFGEATTQGGTSAGRNMTEIIRRLEQYRMLAPHPNEGPSPSRRPKSK